ncbi:hypothetical protein ACQ143_07920 [Microbacterium sp. MC2]
MTFGFAFKSAEFTDSRDAVRLLRGDNIGQGRLRWDGAKRFPQERVGEVTKYQLAIGDVVLAMDRPWIEAGLKYSVVRSGDVPSLLVQRVARLRAKPALDQGYLAAVIGSKEFMDYIVGTQTGSAVPHISGGQIGDFQVDRLPPLAEQAAIARILGVIDDKIESNRRAIVLASALLDAMAVQYGSELPSVPLARLVSTPKNTVNPKTLGEQVVDHYSLPAFDDGARPERTPASTIMSNKLVVPHEAIMVSRLNPRFNRTWWVGDDETQPKLASTEFLVLTAETGIELAGVWLAVRDPYFMSELARRVTGTSGSHQRVRPEDALAIEVPDMSQLDVSTKQQALALLTRIHELRVENASLSLLRDTLLPELLSGRIRVPVGESAA